jgi:voltage-gated potassium channel
VIFSVTHFLTLQFPYIAKNLSMNKELDEKLPLFQLVIIVLSIYVLGALIASTFFRLPEEVIRLLDYIDNGICIIFLCDFGYRFIRAPKKISFMKWGWIDIISSIPTFNYLRAGRALRLIRLLRILRAFRSTKVLLNHVFRRKAQGALTTAFIIALLMLLFSSIAILQVETAPNSNITSAEDALWWAYVTITTVGYGDKFPVTTEGRVIAMLLMTVGVGLFGTFTGFVASWFVEEQKPSRQKSNF